MTVNRTNWKLTKMPRRRNWKWNHKLRRTEEWGTDSWYVQSRLFLRYASCWCTSKHCSTLSVVSHLALPDLISRLELDNLLKDVLTSRIVHVFLLSPPRLPGPLSGLQVIINELEIFRNDGCFCFTCKDIDVHIYLLHLATRVNDVTSGNFVFASPDTISICCHIDS